MATSAAIAGLAVAVGNGWLHWSTRAACKPLQSDARAAQVLNLKLESSIAKAQRRVRVMTKPDLATELASRIRNAPAPFDFHATKHWLHMLTHSLLEYAVAARSMALPNSRRANARAEDRIAHLKQCNLTAGDIANRALPFLHRIAGHAKLCEASLESMATDGDEDSEHSEDLRSCEDLAQVMEDLDDFIREVQKELTLFIP